MGHQHKSLLETDFSNDKEVGKAIESIFQTRSSEKWPYERQWLMQIAWYLGQQNLVWDYHSLIEPSAPPWRVRLVVNLIQSTVNTLIAKTYKGQPQYDVVPATSDSADIAIASMQKQLLEYEWVKNDTDDLILDVLHWIFVTGNCFLKVKWNPNGGPSMQIPAEIRPFVNIDELELGETELQVISPFNIMTDSKFANFKKDAWWVLETNIVSKDELTATFGKEKTKRLQDQSVFTTSHHFQSPDKISQVGKNNKFFNTSPSLNSQGVMVHELWIKPRHGIKGLEKGKRIVYAQDIILNKDTDFPYDHGQMPYIHFSQIKVPGRLWATCTTEQLLPLQSDYNKTKSQLIENRNMMSKPKWTKPLGSRILENSLTDEPGETIEHMPGLEPKVISPPPMPSYVQQMLQEHRIDLQDVSGQHEVSNAQAPGQVRGTGGIAALIEQDESRLGPLIARIDKCIVTMGRQLLQLNKQFVKEERLIKVVGSQDELMVLSFKGEDLVGPNADKVGADYADVRVRTMSGLPLSRVAQQEFVGKLLDRQILNPERDRELILSLLNIGSAEKILDKSRIHRSKQLQEIEQIIQGNDIPVEEWQNHQVHLEVLNDFRNSSRYSILEPDIQAKISSHAEEHERMIAFLAIKPELIQRQVAAEVTGAQQNGQEIQQQGIRQTQERPRADALRSQI